MVELPSLCARVSSLGRHQLKVQQVKVELVLGIDRAALAGYACHDGALWALSAW